MSESQQSSRADSESLSALDAVRWGLLNIIQAAFLIVWTVFMAFPALGAFCLTLNTRASLWMARAVWPPPLWWIGGVKIERRGLDPSLERWLRQEGEAEFPDEFRVTDAHAAPAGWHQYWGNIYRGK